MSVPEESFLKFQYNNSYIDSLHKCRLRIYYRLKHWVIFQRDKSEVEEAVVEKPKPGTREYAAEDLKRLLGRGKETTTTTSTAAAASKADEDEDLPPLIQVVTYMCRCPFTIT